MLVDAPTRYVVFRSALLVTLAALGAAAGQPAKANERDEKLATYLRLGRYADAAHLIDKMLETKPHEDLKNVRAVFGTAPNMRVRRGSADFECRVTDTGVWLPLSVDGGRVNWLVDTGANVSLISDAEATRLGLVIRESSGRSADLAGGSTAVRSAVARGVQIGRTRLQDVTFLVMPTIVASPPFRT